MKFDIKKVKFFPAHVMMANMASKNIHISTLS